MSILNYVTTASAFITGCVCIGGAIYAVVNWYINLKKQSTDIKAIKEENALIVFAICACLEGISQIAPNENITKAKGKLDKHLNKRAHK